jgi:hypothetical protein
MFLSVIMFVSLQRSPLPAVDVIGNAHAAGGIRLTVALASEFGEKFVAPSIARGAFYPPGGE